MNKSRLFMSAGALVLAATALFAAKANKKFTPTNDSYNASGAFWVTFPQLVLTTRRGIGFKTAFVTIVTKSLTPNVVFRTQLYTNISTGTKKPLYID
jgi:hypothetical protein